MKSQTLLTGIFDFHALTLTIMRNTFCKGNPKTNFYRDYKNFDCEMFESKFNYSLQSLQLLDYTCFHNVFLLLLNKYAPIKKIWANHSPFMAKILGKTTMFRSQLKDKFIYIYKYIFLDKGRNSNKMMIIEIKINCYQRKGLS